MAIVAGVGALVAGAMGNQSLANTLGKVALVASIVSVASGAGSHICNVLAKPPPSIYSDITRLDSKALAETTGYQDVSSALQDQPILEAAGSSVYAGKAVAKNAEFLTETLGLSEESAKVVGAKLIESTAKDTLLQAGEAVASVAGKGGTWLERYLYYFNKNSLPGREIFSIFNNPIRDVKDTIQYLAVNLGPKATEIGTKGVYRLALRNADDFFAVLKARPAVCGVLKSAEYLGKALLVPTVFYSAYDIGNAGSSALQATFPNF